MPEGVGYGPQSTASVGKSLNYIGKHCYAYSGTLAATSAETTFLEFSTGSEYIVGTVQISSSDDSNDDLVMVLYLNGEVITVQISTNTYNAYIAGYNEIEVLIPPFSTFKGTIDVTAGSPTDCQMMFNGRVYK